MFGDFRRKCSVISEKLHPFIFLSKDVGQMSVLSLIYGGGEGSLVPSSSSVPIVVAGDNNATSIRFVIPSKYSSYRKDLECIVRTGDGHSAQFRYELTSDQFLLTEELTKNGGEITFILILTDADGEEEKSEPFTLPIQGIALDSVPMAPNQGIVCRFKQ